MEISRRLCLLSAISTVLLGTTAAASDGPTLLTISGNVSEGTVQLDREMLKQLDWRVVDTFTSFTEGLQTFEGPTLASVLEAAGANGSTVFATAINDYTVEFPVSDAADHDVLLAMVHNGKQMRVRDKGPIWVVYPMSKKEAESQLHDAEMIWQLDRIVIE